MHMVIANAARKDPYGIDVLFMYMANMSWNSAMNVPDTIAQLTARDEATGEYVIPRIIYSDAYASEMVHYADLILPDTTYLERWDCISLLDRPISEADGPADSIRQPVVEPDRDASAVVRLDDELQRHAAAAAELQDRQHPHDAADPAAHPRDQRHRPQDLDVEHDRVAIAAAIRAHMSRGRAPKDLLYGDGQAGARIADCLATVPLTIEKRLTY